MAKEEEIAINEIPQNMWPATRDNKYLFYLDDGDSHTFGNCKLLPGTIISGLPLKGGRYDATMEKDREKQNQDSSKGLRNAKLDECIGHYTTGIDRTLLN